MRKLIWKVILLFLGAVLLLGVLFLIVTSIFLTLLFQTRTTVSHDLSYYPIAAGQVESEKGYPPICEALPALSELEPYENLEFSHVRKKYGIFQSDSYILQLQYTEQDYLAAAEKLSKRYTFCTEPVPNHGSQEIALSFSIGDFYFRPVETDGTWEFFFPKKLLFVGYNDKTSEIVFISFNDIDIDYIDRPIEEFIQTECLWTPKGIREP